MIVYQIAFSRFPVMLFGRTESSCKGIDFRGLLNIRVGFRFICQKNSSKVHFCIYLFMFVFSRCWRIREKHNCQADEVSTFLSCTERAKWTPFSLLFFLLPLASLMRCTTDTTLDYTLEEYSFSSAKQCQTPIIVSMGGNTPCKLQYKQVSCIMVMKTTQQHTSVRACERMSCIWNTFLINVFMAAFTITSHPHLRSTI